MVRPKMEFSSRIFYLLKKKLWHFARNVSIRKYLLATVKFKCWSILFLCAIFGQIWHLKCRWWLDGTFFRFISVHGECNLFNRKSEIEMFCIFAVVAHRQKEFHFKWFKTFQFAQIQMARFECTGVYNVSTRHKRICV